MPKITTAELQFCLALIGRASDQAALLVWRTAANGRQFSCDIDEFRLHIGPSTNGDGVELSVSDRDGWPMLHLNDAAYVGPDAAFIRNRLAEVMASAVRSTPVAVVPAPVVLTVVETQKVETPALHPAEDVQLARLVRRLGTPEPARARARRTWFPRPTWGLSPEVVPLTGQA